MLPRSREAVLSLCMHLNHTELVQYTCIHCSGRRAVSYCTVLFDSTVNLLHYCLSCWECDSPADDSIVHCRMRVARQPHAGEPPIKISLASHFRAHWWLFPRVRGFGENVRQIIPRLRFFFFFFFTVEITRAHLFHSLGQDQSTVAQRAEMTVTKHSLMSACQLVSL